MSSEKLSNIDEKRRELLVELLSIGAFASTAALLPANAHAGLFGNVPKKLPAGKSIYKIKGEVFVNSKTANQDTSISANDTVKTGKNSQVIFVTGTDAFILHENSELTLSGSGILLYGLRLATGRLLSVFGRRSKKASTLMARTTTATIGIRGTGVYLESEPNQSYVCTCYGEVELNATADKNSRESITSQHHDAPRYIAATGEKGKLITPAPMQNHTDLELMLIEELVGRTPPFSVSNSGYSTPKRDY